MTLSLSPGSLTWNEHLISHLYSFKTICAFGIFFSFNVFNNMFPSVPVEGGGLAGEILDVLPHLYHSPFQQLWDHRQVKRENYSVNCWWFSRNISLASWPHAVGGSQPRALRIPGNSHLIWSAQSWASLKILLQHPELQAILEIQKAQLNFPRKGLECSDIRGSDLTCLAVILYVLFNIFNIFIYTSH